MIGVDSATPPIAAPPPLAQVPPVGARSAAARAADRDRVGRHVHAIFNPENEIATDEPGAQGDGNRSGRR